jgi:hypothetical protein
MQRYFTGINGESFLKGFDSDNSVFHKDRVEGIKHPSQIYFVRNPIVLDLGDTIILIKRKFFARRAIGLSRKHGGLPVILECFPQESNVSRDEDHKHWYVLDCPSVTIGPVYCVKRKFSILGEEFAYQLEEIEPRQARGLPL